MKQYISIFSFLVFISSCFEKTFEKEYYERVSGIKFPNHYKVLESFDNGEWLTGTVLAIDSVTLANYIVDHRFKTLQNLKDFHLISVSYLTEYKPNFKTTNNVYYISESRGKNSWTYVADLNSKKLWAEIQYPDWSGD